MYQPSPPPSRYRPPGRSGKTNLPRESTRASAIATLLTSYNNPDTLAIRFDRREAVLWPKRDSQTFEDFDPAIRHLVVVASDGKRIQSFWFRFSDYHADSLCLSFDGYQGVDLQKSTPRCKCK